VDNPIQIGINTDPSDEGESLVEDFYWPVQDANFNVLGLVASDGTLQERYEYTPYGERTVYKRAGSADEKTSAPLYESQRVEVATVRQPYGLCDLGHQGLFFDKEFGQYENRRRMYHPSLSLWMQRDPIGMLVGVAPGSLEHKLRERLREAIASWVASVRSEGSAEEKIRYIDRILESPSCIGQSDLLNKMAAQLREEAIRVERPSIPDELLVYGNGMSLYEYCSGRPVFGIDPTGCGFFGDLWRWVKNMADTIVGSPYTTSESIAGMPPIVAAKEYQKRVFRKYGEIGSSYNPETDEGAVQLKKASGAPLSPTEQATWRKWAKKNQICP
jgi:RHS repeat-associated protein